MGGDDPAAGMVSVGRLNMSEFAFSGIGINPNFGTPANPRSTDVPRIPGGSSSGSGVAVAAGIVPVAMGTDTGGSVRIPAALNGIVGYKATRGRYDMAGVFPLSGSLDSLGPLCHTVSDAVWIDAAMCGATAPTVRASSLKGLEVIIPTNVVFDGTEPAVIAAFEEAVARLEAVGVTFVRAVMPGFSELLELMSNHGALVTAEAYWLHRARITGADAGMIDPRVVARTRIGADISMTDYIDILDARRRLISRSEAFIGNRLVAFPTVAHVAPPVEPLKSDDDLFVATNAKTLRNTMLGNFLDWCGVTVPCGTGDAGMPVGFLLSGPANSDDTVLGAALAAEATIPVINGLTDLLHPCQAMADLQTIAEHGDPRKATVAWVGDGNNMANSLALLASVLGMNLRLATPSGYRPASRVMKHANLLAEKTGAVISWSEDPAEAVRDAGFVYTDTWTSMGQEAEAEERRQIFARYQVNGALIAEAPKAWLMHCLPAHRGEEITGELLDGERSLVYEQAENRLHAQKAVLERVMLPKGAE